MKKLNDIFETLFNILEKKIHRLSLRRRQIQVLNHVCLDPVARLSEHLQKAKAPSDVFGVGTI